MPSTCASTEELCQLLGGALDDKQTTEIRQHLADCAECQESLDQLSEKPALQRWASSCRSLRLQAPEEPELARLLEKLRAAPPTEAYLGSKTSHLANSSLTFLAPPEQEGDLGVLGPYRVLAELGRGGMGIVLLAYDQKLCRTVALKVLPPDRADDKARARFVREARAAAGLDHDHIVPVFAVANPPDGPAYLVMPYVEGPTLGERIKEEGRLDPWSAARICLQVAEGLVAAHRAKLVHRDIKPANIILDRARGRAKIMDFGLVRTTSLPGGITQAGSVLGTPHYMSPEQVQAPDRIDERTDVYSLGVTLYEALTGEVPFRGESHLVLQQVVRDDPLPPRRRSDKIPRDLETICLHCMEKEPGKRYASAGALAEDLRRFLAAEPIQARPVRAWERVVKWARRRPAAAALVAVSSLASLLLVTGLAVGILLIADKQRQTETALEEKGQAYEREKDAREEIDKAYQRERLISYFNRIALAEREISAGNWGRAKELLDECEDALRGWEWHYLERLRHVPPSTLELGEHVSTSEGFDLAFSPDSSLLAVPKSDNSILVWDTATNRELLHLRGHTDRVLNMAFSPDGRRLASTSADKTVRIWDLANGVGGVLTPQFTLRGHKDKVLGVAFSPDRGRLLASSSNDQTVKLWDAVTGECLCDFPGQPIPNLHVNLAFSADGRWLASGSTNNTVKVWDVTTRRVVFTLLGHTQPILSVAFSADSRRLISAGRDRELRIWDLAPGEPGASAPEGRVLTSPWTVRGISLGVWCAALSPDGRHLAVGGPISDGSVRVYDVTTKQLVYAVSGHVRVVSVAFSPDGRRLASAGLDKNVRLWETTTGSELLTLHGHKDVVGRVLFSPNGQRLASASSDGTVWVRDASPFDEDSDRRIRTLRGHTGPIYGVAFSPDRRHLASASSDQSVIIWDVQAGREVHTLKRHKHTVFSVAFSPDGERLASGSFDKTVKLWNARTGVELFTLDDFQAPVRSVAFSSDGETLVTGSQQTMQLWDLRTRQRLLGLIADPEWVQCVAFSPDGKLVATTGSSGTARVWDAKTGAEVCSFREHRTQVFSVAFHPSGNYLASGDGESQVVIWNPASGRKIRSLTENTDNVSSIAFSPDGHWLATASWKEVIVWDATTFAKIQTLSRFTGTIWSVAFSPDGKQLAAVGGYKGKGEIKIWDSTLWQQSVVRSP